MKSTSLRFVVAVMVSGSLIAQTDVRREIQSHYERAQTALKANQPEIASQEFREILRLDPKSASAYANLGVIAFQHADYARAVEAFSAAVKLNPLLWDAQALLGLSHARLGHSREASPLLEQSLSHVQNQRLRTEIGVNLIRIAQESNTPERTVDVLREIGRSNPNDPETLYLAYRVYSDLAARAVGALAQAAPESARMRQILAQAALTQDDAAGAIAEYRKALEVEPHLPGLHYELGRAIIQRSVEESSTLEAQKEFETELAANPRDANSEYGLGEVYSFRSNPRLAGEHYSRAIELRPDFADAHLGLGKVLSSTGRSEEALAHFREAVRLDPSNEIAHYRLAQAYRKSGQAEEAEREQAIFQKLRKSHAPAHSAAQSGQKPARTRDSDTEDQ